MKNLGKMKQTDVMIQLNFFFLELTFYPIRDWKSPFMCHISFLVHVHGRKELSPLAVVSPLLVCLHSCLLGPPLYFSLTSPFVHLHPFAACLGHSVAWEGDVIVSYLT